MTPDPAATGLVHSSMPLCATLGVTASQADGDGAVLHLDWRPELCTIGGLMHGGTIMAVADSAGAVAAYMNLPEGAVGTSTISSHTNFLGGVKEGTITASAKVLHKGSSTVVVETTVTDDRGKVVGKVTQTQSVLRPKP
ncbi:MAG: PaaI family thioesterase [Actinomycetota bacterium]|nr:PaaI family thioesterase [Actinomycetota bacterium]